MWFPHRENSLNILALLGVTAFVFWVCAFKIFDADFFWHVTAGRLMRQTGWLITTDPFAYTREGLPYLANHEWLAQVILSLIFDLFGPTGVIFLRSLLVTAAVVPILLIGRKHLWIYAPLAMLAALTIRGGAMDRPHLWTWVMVAAFLLLSARVLERGRMQWKDVLIFIGLEILWVNFHGGAALLGVVISAALVAELILCERTMDVRAALPLFLIVALMISPLGWQNITYIQTLLTDSTTRFIAEWQPRAWAPYLRDLWPFWLAALGALAITRKHLVFSILLLAVTGYLSRTAYRHEMLFVLVATAMTIFQLEQSDVWERGVRWMHERWTWSVPSMVIAVIVLIWYARSENLAFANRYHAHGYGIIDRTADAVTFLDREKLTGKVFNTYDLGSELLYHFFPERKIFVDGRNVDYGEEFLSRLFAAATDADAWRALEEQNSFAIAIVDTADLHNDFLPYITHLQNNPHWTLIYLDDAVAVYVKDVPEYREIVARSRYRLLTPLNLQSGDILQTISDPKLLVSDLLQSIEQAPHGVDARLLLARFLIAQGLTGDADLYVQETLALAPDNYRPHEVLGLLRAREGKFDEAEKAFGAALARLGREEARPIRAYIGKIFNQLDEQKRARRYRQ